MFDHLEGWLGDDAAKIIGVNFVRESPVSGVSSWDKRTGWSVNVCHRAFLDHFSMDQRYRFPKVIRPAIRLLSVICKSIRSKLGPPNNITIREVLK